MTKMINYIYLCVLSGISSSLALRLVSSEPENPEKIESPSWISPFLLDGNQDPAECPMFQGEGNPFKIEQSPIKKFVIYSFPRSGSNWLVSLLSETKSTNANTEIFNGKEVYATFPGWERWNQVSRDQNRNGFINDMFHQAASQNFSHSGFKALMWPNKQLYDAEFQSLNEASDIKKVVHIRKNLVEQFLSWRKANEAAAWSDVDTSKIKVNFEVGKFLHFAKEMEFIQEKCLSSKDWHFMTYEDLVSDTQKEMTALHDFLGMERQEVCADCILKKQDHSAISNSITNWEEVFAALKGTKYEAMLGMDSPQFSTIKDLKDDS